MVVLGNSARTFYAQCPKVGTPNFEFAFAVFLEVNTMDSGLQPTASTGTSRLAVALEGSGDTNLS